MWDSVGGRSVGEVWRRVERVCGVGEGGQWDKFRPSLVQEVLITNFEHEIHNDVTSARKGEGAQHGVGKVRKWGAFALPCVVKEERKKRECLCCYYYIIYC